MQEPVSTATLPPLATAESVDLVFVVDGHTSVRALPPSGRLVIGRDAESGVCVPHRSLSREHAAISIPSLSLEDLGSTNGTFVRHALPDGTSAETRVLPGHPVTLSPGASVRLGAVTLVLVPSFVRDHPSAVPTSPVLVDARMREIDALVARVAPSDIPVLVLGETGVGKEVLAEKIHRASHRRSRALLRLNCAALSEQLVESELFGHEKGAFTGAVVAKPGLLETASGGTVLLDEIGDLRLESQAKLLRVIEEGKVTRVGGVTPRAVDVRFVAATHQDLERAVTAGTFRRDLYFRLAGVVLRVPPLRERPAEVIPLAREFLRASCARHRRVVEPSLAPDAVDFLCSHTWPGNIRELRHCIERAVLLCDGPAIERRHLDTSSPNLAPSSPPPSSPPPSVPPPPPTAPPPPPGARVDPPARNTTSLTRESIESALERCAGNQTRAAKSLGVSRRTLVTWIERFGIARPRGDR